MSDRLPYEEQLAKQWSDLPLPDENMAWEDMKRRLEEDDDDPIVPLWLRGCGLWGLLLLTLSGLGWWFFQKNTTENKKELTPKEQLINQKEKSADKKDWKDTIILIDEKPVEKSADKKTYEDAAIPAGPVSVNRTTNTSNKNKVGVDDEKKKINKRVNPTLKQKPVKATAKIKENKKLTDKPKPESSSSNKIKEATDRDATLSKNSEPLENNYDILSKQTISTKNSDTAVVVSGDTTVYKIEEQVNEKNMPEKGSLKSKSVSFSAGVALHQLLPIDGQKLTPYNSQGRKGSLADYIPSLYFRMYKNEKWFLQSEFRYGAPQYNREIIYQQQTRRDTFGITNTITSARLKKTFYHQLPVSVNYFVLPNWSVGGGFVWNTFKGAVSERDVVVRIIATGVDSVLSKGAVLATNKADSNFARSYFQALMETQYKWKRFSFGARYSFGLQPYLKFTLPGGTQQHERNRSLQIFIRYQLWKSKAKSLKEKKR